MARNTTPIIYNPLGTYDCNLERYAKCETAYGYNWQVENDWRLWSGIKWMIWNVMHGGEFKHETHKALFEIQDSLFVMANLLVQQKVWKQEYRKINENMKVVYQKIVKKNNENCIVKKEIIWNETYAVVGEDIMSKQQCNEKSNPGEENQLKWLHLPLYIKLKFARTMRCLIRALQNVVKKNKEVKTKARDEGEMKIMRNGYNTVLILWEAFEIILRKQLLTIEEEMNKGVKRVKIGEDSKPESDAEYERQFKGFFPRKNHAFQSAVSTLWKFQNLIEETGMQCCLKEREKQHGMELNWRTEKSAENNKKDQEVTILKSIVEKQYWRKDKTFKIKIHKKKNYDC